MEKSMVRKQKDSMETRYEKKIYLSNENYNYFFSNIAPIWGWATWADRWIRLEFCEMDINESFVQSIKIRYPNEVYKNFFIQIFKIRHLLSSNPLKICF